MAACTQGAAIHSKAAEPGRPTALRRYRTGCGGEPTPCVPLMRRGGRRLQSDHKSIGSARWASSGLFVAAELTGDRLVLRAAARSASAPRRAPRNWGYQRVANCRYGAVEIITRHALAAAVGSAPCDRVAVQQNPRTGVDIQSYRASSG